MKNDTGYLAESLPRSKPKQETDESKIRLESIALLTGACEQTTLFQLTLIITSQWAFGVLLIDSGMIEVEISAGNLQNWQPKLNVVGSILQWFNFNRANHATFENYVR
jgi:hypothetical protein